MQMKSEDKIKVTNIQKMLVDYFYIIIFFHIMRFLHQTNYGGAISSHIKFLRFHDQIVLRRGSYHLVLSLGKRGVPV